MIRCTLELLPGGLEEDVQHLGTIEISNDVLATLESKGRRGSYIYEIQKKRKGRIVSKGLIADYPREAYSVWELVRRILEKEKGRL